MTGNPRSQACDAQQLAEADPAGWEKWGQSEYLKYDNNAGHAPIP